MLAHGRPSRVVDQTFACASTLLRPSCLGSSQISENLPQLRGED